MCNSFPLALRLPRNLLESWEDIKRTVLLTWIVLLPKENTPTCDAFSFENSIFVNTKTVRAQRQVFFLASIQEACHKVYLT